MSNGIITLDGPAGVGKTTLARELAQALKLPYLDTGAMFRFLALHIGESGLSLPADQLVNLAKQWEFSLQGFGNDTSLLANGKPIGEEIRTEEVSALASRLGQRPEIRAILREAQQRLGKQGPLVAEGRDLGTVVFPEASHKFFLDAKPEVRAKRRWQELRQKGKAEDLGKITEMIRQRDALDRNRAIAPLKPAPDAQMIDTSELTIAEVLAELLKAMGAKNQPGLE